MRDGSEAGTGLRTCAQDLHETIAEPFMTERINADYVPVSLIEEVSKRMGSDRAGGAG